jgi:hypothetical protein
VSLFQPFTGINNKIFREADMRRSYAVPGISVLMLGCVAVFGGDSWRDKASSDWTADEVTRILNDSPWAQQVKLQMGEGGRGSGMGRGGGMGGPGGGGGGWGGRGGGMGGPGGGGGGWGGGGGGGGWGGNRGGQGGDSTSGRPTQALVRWQSALPVQQALVKQNGSPATPATPEAQAQPPATPAATSAPAPDSEYIIAVSGLPQWQGRPRRDADGDNGDQNSGASDEDRRAAMLDRMKESTTLTAKGKSPFGPDKVERAADGSLLFYFPKSEQPLSLDDKEVEFATRMGRMELKYKFKLKDMTYQGKLAL